MVKREQVKDNKKWNSGGIKLMVNEDVKIPNLGKLQRFITSKNDAVYAKVTEEWLIWKAFTSDKAFSSSTLCIQNTSEYVDYYIRFHLV